MTTVKTAAPATPVEAAQETVARCHGRVAEFKAIIANADAAQRVVIFEENVPERVVARVGENWVLAIAEPPATLYGPEARTVCHMLNKQLAKENNPAKLITKTQGEWAALMMVNVERVITTLDAFIARESGNA